MKLKLLVVFSRLLATRPFTQEVLEWIFKWCCIPAQRRPIINDYINFAANWGNCPTKKKTLLAIIYIPIWSIWNVRNDKVFSNISSIPTKTRDYIISLVYGWVKHKGKSENYNWAGWSCPFYMCLFFFLALITC